MATTASTSPVQESSSSFLPTFSSPLNALQGYVSALGGNLGGAAQAVEAPAGRTVEDYVFMLIGVIFIIVGIILAVATSAIGSKTIEVATKAAVA